MDSLKESVPKEPKNKNNELKRSFQTKEKALINNSEVFESALDDLVNVFQ